MPLHNSILKLRQGTEMAQCYICSLFLFIGGSMRRGWEVEYEDGTVIKEVQMAWRKIPKINIVRVTLHYEGRRWDLTDKEAYDQKKRGSMVPGMPETFQIESRSIGYYDIVNDEPVKIWYTVNEFTGKMTMEVKKL